MKNVMMFYRSDRVLPLRAQIMKYRKPLIITASVLVLQLVFGWDAKFCIINIIWLFV